MSELYACGMITTLLKAPKNLKIGRKLFSEFSHLVRCSVPIMTLNISEDVQKGAMNTYFPLILLLVWADKYRKFTIKTRLLFVPHMVSG